MAQAQFNYTTNNGTITITGYTGPGGAVTIPDTINGLPVTSIGDGAFYKSTNLASVTIPSSITSIGYEAFWGCNILTAIIVTLDNSNYSSVDGMLFNKTQTTLIQCPEGKTGDYTIPSGVTSIGNWAFGGCARLASVTIPASVTDIEEGAFVECTSLTAITVDLSNSTYGSVAGVLLDKSRTTLIQCPGGKTGHYTIPSSVIRIGDASFNSCTKIASVTIGTSVTSIGDSAFYGCTNLTSVTIPDSITSIESYAFGGCTSLENVTIPSGVTSILDWAFSGCTSLASVTIPSDVNRIGYAAFYGCASLERVTIPGGVTIIGGRAFSYCTSLNRVYFEGNAPLDLGAFFGANSVTLHYLPGTTGWGPTFGGRPTALWRPLVQVSDSSLGVRTNQFGFNISWASGRVVVVEACTDLAQPIWSPVGTNTLTAGSSYFSDPQWTNHPARFYRLRSP